MKTMLDALGDLPRLKRMIDAASFDAIVAASPENIRYVGDVGVWTQTVIRERPVFIVWPAGGEPIYIVGSIEVPRIREDTWIRDIRVCDQTSKSAIGTLVEVLRELRLERGRIAIESDYLPARWQAMLQHDLPEVTIVAAEPVFSAARMHKSKAERELLAGAFRRTQQAFLSTFQELRPGETERVVATRLTTRMLEAGADAPAFIFVTAGVNSLLPHPHPSDYAFRRGDVIKSDSGAFFNDYFTNLGRTMKLGPLDDEDRSYWAKLRDIQDRIADMLRPGNTGRQLFETARTLYAQAGWSPPNTHNGHGIGLRIHERPMISADEDTPYEPGMMTTVETRTQVRGRHAYHMEDLFEVTEGAPILHSGPFPSRDILSIGHP